MKNKQLHFFDMVEKSVQSSKPKVRTWYYVTRRRDTEMLAGFYSDGSPMWVEHDLQRVIPHIFSNSRTATKYKYRLKGDAVRSSRFQVIGGRRVSF